MRIVIGEDSVLFREGLAALLADSGHDIVAKADDAPSVLRAVQAHEPDLVIIDVRMPPDLTDDGARAAREIRDRHPNSASSYCRSTSRLGTPSSSWHAADLGICSRTASSTSTTSSTH